MGMPADRSAKRMNPRIARPRAARAHRFCAGQLLEGKLRLRARRRRRNDRGRCRRWILHHRGDARPCIGDEIFGRALAHRGKGAQSNIAATAASPVQLHTTRSDTPEPVGGSRRKRPSRTRESSSMLERLRLRDEGTGCRSADSIFIEEGFGEDGSGWNLAPARVQRRGRGRLGCNRGRQASPAIQVELGDSLLRRALRAAPLRSDSRRGHAYPYCPSGRQIGDSQEAGGCFGLSSARSSSLASAPCPMVTTTSSNASAARSCGASTRACSRY